MTPRAKKSQVAPVCPFRVLRSLCPLADRDAGKRQDRSFCRAEWRSSPAMVLMLILARRSTGSSAADGVACCALPDRGRWR